MRELQTIEKLPDLKLLSSEQKDHLIVEMFSCIQKLEEELKELRAQIAKNSSNSNKPPSSDGLKKPAPKSARKKSGLNTGGQQGHMGNTLEPVSEPDFVETHKLEAELCAACSMSLLDVVATEEFRQEFEIPVAKVQVTEHRGEVKICPACGEKNKAERTVSLLFYFQIIYCCSR